MKYFMNYFKKKKNCFFDMNKPEIINQSIVLVDNICYGDIRNKTINLNSDCFIDISSLAFLKTVIKKTKALLMVKEIQTIPMNLYSGHSYLTMFKSHPNLL